MSSICTLITGASSGIGQRISIQLSNEKNIIICGRSVEKLNETMKLSSSKNKIISWVFDLENILGIKDSLEILLKEHDIVVDSFVHCAGNMKVMHMRNMDYKNSLQLFNINFFSATEIIALLLKKKINQSQLHNIVFISAILGEFGAPGHHLYSASKAALDGLMRSLAVELAPEIRVNSVLPGGVKTPMSEKALNDPTILEKALKEYPLGIGDTEDIANMVEFLLSNKAKWITGQKMIVDGGRTINLSHK